MQFYKIDIPIEIQNEDNDERPPKRRRRHYFSDERENEIAKSCMEYSEKLNGNGVMFLGEITCNRYRFGMIVREPMDVEKHVNNYCHKENITLNAINIREITLYDFSSILQDAVNNDYVQDEADVLRMYGIEELYLRRIRGMGFNYEEFILQPQNEKTIRKIAERYQTKGLLIPELDRICLGTKGKKAYGQPVDYIISTDDENTRTGTIQALLSSLYNAGRIKNRRFTELNLEPDSNFVKRTVETFYAASADGTVVVILQSKESDDNDVARGEYHYLADFCNIVKRHCRDVLTVICMPFNNKALKSIIYENLASCTFIEIKDEQAADDEAVKYFKQRAKEYGVRTDKALLNRLESGHGYFIPELNEMFDEWYNFKLKTTVYDQYKDISCAKSLIKEEKPKGSAYDELESMIGLTSAKEIIHQALDYYKAQILFKDKGLSGDSLCNHMIFTGNPGTAKTTVARLFARILKDNKVLTRGHIVEVGRSDLVGKYVGWTAPTIKKKFKEAVGGILFIDEAYSLVDDRNGSYGDEAINTIVQEMENRRDEVIVIFAGYPDKMEQFLDKNPGLRSRISHHVHFDDYNTEELCQIASFIASKNGFKLDESAIVKISEIMKAAGAQPDFGNGRFVRNIVEKARMTHGSRLVKMDYDTITADDVKTLVGEDFEIPDAKRTKHNRVIGFISE